MALLPPTVPLIILALAELLFVNLFVMLIVPLVAPASILLLLALAILSSIYLFRPAVARIFELGPGPVELPVAEAGALERVLRRRSWD